MESPSPSLAPPCGVDAKGTLLEASFATEGNPAKSDKGGEVLSEV